MSDRRQQGEPSGRPHSRQTRVLHRLREVRLRVGLSLAEIAGHMGLPEAVVAREEDPATDIPISTVLRWQRVLGTDLSHLLVEPESEMALGGLTGERLSALESAAAEIARLARDQATRVFAEGLCRQLAEMRPSSSHRGDWAESNSSESSSA